MDDEDARFHVFTVVTSAGSTLEDLRAAIEACVPHAGALTRARRQAAIARALNSIEEDGTTPLAVANFLDRGDMVGALIDAGAQTDFFPMPWSNKAALCIRHGQAETLRRVMREGGQDPNWAYVDWEDWDEDDDDAGPPATYTLINMCVESLSPGRLACLEVLVNEFGADINRGDPLMGRTPLNWLPWMAGPPELRDAALELLLRLGADVKRPDDSGDTPLHDFARGGPLAAVLRLIERGALVDVACETGQTPLMTACFARRHIGDREGVVFELLARSSPAARRAVTTSGYSAIDLLVGDMGSSPPPPPIVGWVKRVVAELLRAGAPVAPENAERVLPVAIEVMARQDDERALFESGRLWDWRGHEAVVGLVFDLQHAAEEEAIVAARKATRCGSSRPEVRRREAERSGGGGGGRRQAAGGDKRRARGKGR